MRAVCVAVQGRGCVHAQHSRSRPELFCFALPKGRSRANACRFETTHNAINARFIVEQLEGLSWALKRITVVVLDNAPAHVAKQVGECREVWQQRGLFLFYLPPYSPHLNITRPTSTSPNCCGVI